MKNKHIFTLVTASFPSGHISLRAEWLLPGKIQHKLQYHRVQVLRAKTGMRRN